MAHVSLTPPSDPHGCETLRKVIAEQLTKRLFANIITLAVHLMEHDEAATNSGNSSRSYDAARFQDKREGGGAGRWIVLVEFSEPSQAPFASGPALVKNAANELEKNGANDVVWRIYGLICAINA